MNHLKGISTYDTYYIIKHDWSLGIIGQHGNAGNLLKMKKLGSSSMVIAGYGIPMKCTTNTPTNKWRSK